MKTKSIGITKRQQDTLNFIKQFKEEKGYMPTIREICKGINVSSTETAHTHLKELINKGYIEFGGGNRTYRIIEDTPKEDKKIEKLEKLNTDYFMEQKKYGALTNEEIVLDIQTLKNYINKLVEKLNGE